MCCRSEHYYTCFISVKEIINHRFKIWFVGYCLFRKSYSKAWTYILNIYSKIISLFAFSPKQSNLVNPKIKNVPFHLKTGKEIVKLGKNYLEKFLPCWADMYHDDAWEKILEKSLLMFFLMSYETVIFSYLWRSGLLFRMLPRWCSGKESTYKCRRHKRHELDPWVRKIPWRKKWQPNPEFLPGESKG